MEDPRTVDGLTSPRVNRRLQSKLKAIGYCAEQIIDSYHYQHPDGRRVTLAGDNGMESVVTAKEGCR